MFDDIIGKQKEIIYKCDFDDCEMTAHLKRPLKEWLKCTHYKPSKNNLCAYNGYGNICKFKIKNKFTGKYKK